MNAQHSALMELPDAVVADLKSEVDWAPLIYFCLFEQVLQVH